MAFNQYGKGLLLTQLAEAMQKLGIASLVQRGSADPVSQGESETVQHANGSLMGFL
jgi:hypothetical protein